MLNAYDYEGIQRQLNSLKDDLENLQVQDNPFGKLVDYSAVSTVTGWAATPTKNIKCKQDDKTLKVWFSITGTSNATGASFTLPAAIVAGLPNTFLFRGQDNGGARFTGIGTVAGSTVTLYATLSGGAWTNSGAKEVDGQFEIAIG